MEAEAAYFLDSVRCPQEQQCPTPHLSSRASAGLLQITSFFSVCMPQASRENILKIEGNGLEILQGCSVAVSMLKTLGNVVSE